MGHHGGVPFDAVLLISFGGPEGPDDVVPFLESVTAGRGIPRERLREVGAHYALFGGRSPINDANRALIAALQPLVDLPVFWANRHWHPVLDDTLSEMVDRGVTRAVGLLTTPYAGPSACRAYRTALDAARARVGARAPIVEVGRPWFDRSAFQRALARELAATIDGLSPATVVLCSAHSVPLAHVEASDYLGQLGAVAAAVCGAGAPGHRYELVYQSRSGPPTQPWLEPDVNERMEQLADEGVTEVVVCPIGFTSDHMEVVYDLDTQAAATAERLGLVYRRSATPGVALAPLFADIVAAATTTGRVSQCAVACCSVDPTGRLPRGVLRGG